MHSLVMDHWSWLPWSSAGSGQHVTMNTPLPGLRSKCSWLLDAPPAGLCFKCGRPGHVARDCTAGRVQGWEAASAVCNRCGSETCDCAGKGDYFRCVRAPMWGAVELARLLRVWLLPRWVPFGIRFKDSHKRQATARKVQLLCRASKQWDAFCVCMEGCVFQPSPSGKEAFVSLWCCAVLPVTTSAVLPVTPLQSCLWPPLRSCLWHLCSLACDQLWPAGYKNEQGLDDERDAFFDFLSKYCLWHLRPAGCDSEQGLDDERDALILLFERLSVTLASLQLLVC